jgi:hypothetical protein
VGSEQVIIGDKGCALGVQRLLKAVLLIGSTLHSANPVLEKLFKKMK